MMLLAGPSASAAQNDAADHARLSEVLRLGPGSVVADVGAGPEALLTVRMATTVGPSGKVYATDIGDMLTSLRDSVRKAGLQNVEIIEGHSSSTNLQPECCEGIFIRNVYHHFRRSRRDERELVEVAEARWTTRNHRLPPTWTRGQLTWRSR